MPWIIRSTGKDLWQHAGDLRIARGVLAQVGRLAAGELFQVFIGGLCHDRRDRCRAGHVSIHRCDSVSPSASSNTRRRSKARPYRFRAAAGSISRRSPASSYDSPSNARNSEDGTIRLGQPLEHGVQPPGRVAGGGLLAGRRGCRASRSGGPSVATSCRHPEAADRDRCRGARPSRAAAA